MTSAPDDRGRPRTTAPSGRFIFLAFALAGLGIIGSTLWEVSQTRTLQDATAEIVNNMLTSIRLLGDLETAIDRRQLLINRYIVASSAGEMRAVEAELTAVDRKVSAEMRAYEQWVTLPGEGEAWDRTRAHLSTLDEPVARALDYARRNEDKAARDAMDTVENRFDEIDQDFDDLIAINNQGAYKSLARYSEIRRQLILTLVLVGLASLVLTLSAGAWAWKQVALREEKMTATAETLKVQNRELDAFAGRVAHDIRGAMTSMSLAMTAISQKLPTDDRSTAALLRGATRMETLVDDLLSLARVGEAMLGRCDPAEVVAQLASEFAPRLGFHGGTLQVSATHAEVACNEGLLRQAVTNLIDNAIKYRRPDVPLVLDVSGAAVGSAYDLRVTDNGLGMTLDETAHAFEPFYRSPRTRELPGTGLGLSIVKRVVESAGGTISVETTLGRGSAFSVRLRLAAGPAAAEGRA
jgi:signal transduction histidine kinase